MASHRVSLNDREIELVVSALRARAAGVADDRRAELLWLAMRLDEGVPGNPHWIHQTPPERRSAPRPRARGSSAAD